MVVHRGQHLVEGAAGPGLEVLHGLEGVLVGLLAGAGHTILDHPAEVVGLVPIDERVVDADVGQAAAQEQGVGD